MSPKHKKKQITEFRLELDSTFKFNNLVKSGEYQRLKPN